MGSWFKLITIDFNFYIPWFKFITTFFSITLLVYFDVIIFCNLLLYILLQKKIIKIFTDNEIYIPTKRTITNENKYETIKIENKQKK